MKSSDAAHLGALMDASHESLRSDFEVSSEALDVMVDCARAATGCLGARMTGAGFGGCAVALVGEAETDGFAEVVAGSYRERTGNEPSVYVCSATDGAAVMVEK
jgi:galactokinase